MTLPEGTVTFLFTDIEGSTRLWEQQPEAMRAALARHDLLLREVIHRGGGAIIKSTGDGLQAVFVSAGDALRAAQALQRAMMDEPWPADVGHFQIRIAIHSGTAELRDGDYYGPAVNRVARLLAAGHGGQILLSQATQALLGDDLSDGLSYVDLGEHRLRDLHRPERIFQLQGPGLPEVFPALRKTAVKPSNLPIQPTPFIGREQEVAALLDLLSREDVRLVTLSGPGGVGKTRLAVEVASILQPKFEDGVFFIDLAPVENPESVADTVAGVLNVRTSGGQTLAEALIQFLSRRSLLLVVDNFEHLIDGVYLLADIFQETAHLKVLVTSREALNLREEWLYPIKGMPFPTGIQNGDLLAYSAVRLFIEAAHRVRPDFNLADEEAGVVRVCQLVEGIPLGIELAAAWTKTLSSEAIAGEIERNIDFLATRMRNLPARHRSVRAAFDYSWQRLSQAEKTVFRRLSVFRGGFVRPAAEEVAGASLLLLTGLADKSLLHWEPEADPDPSKGRFRIHELLRQYGDEQLTRSPIEHTQIHDLHCTYYAEFCRLRFADSLQGRQREAIVQIGAELENVLAAWRWAIAGQKPAEIIQITTALNLLYQLNSQYLQGTQVLQEAVHTLIGLKLDEKQEAELAALCVETAWLHIRLGQLDEAESILELSQTIVRRSHTLPMAPGQATDPSLALGIIASIKGNYVELARQGEQARQTSEVQNHQLNRMFAYYLLTRAAVAQGHYTLAQQHAQQMLEINKETKDRWFLAYCYIELGHIAFGLGNLDAAKKHYETSYVIREEFNDPEGMAVALNHLGQIALRQQAYEAAQDTYQRSFAIYEEIGDRGGLAAAYDGLANTAVGLGQYQKAGKQFQSALRTAFEIEFAPLSLTVLTGIGELLLRTGLDEQGQEILRFVIDHSASEFATKKQAQVALENYGSSLQPKLPRETASHERYTGLSTVVETALAHLKVLDEMLAAGSYEISTAPQAGKTPNQLIVESLTQRELEVLQLISEGRTNQQIADFLVISAGTVKWYTGQIYGKLNVRNRTQAVARARELELLS